ncbi:MAG: hypothetical protein V3U11_11715 [Planctomycetota bacterium]
MSETATTPAPANTAKTARPRGPASILVRPWPKVVFLYPVFVLATLFWIFSLFSSGGGEGEEAARTVGSTWMGNTFMMVLFINLMVFSFDFSRIKSITIVFGLIALGFFLYFLDVNWQIMGGVNDALSRIDNQMNSWFYGTFSVMLGFILLLVLINTRFNYYEINHREVLHHHGYLGDVTRLPTQGLQLHKEINDLLEFALLRSGRLILYPPSRREYIVIDNVLNVNYVEERLKDLLSVVAVRMTAPEEPL